MPPLRTLLVLALALLPVFGQPEALWIRHPKISPDGQKIAFSALGEIWVVSVQGGPARALTSSASYDAHPIWAPDGQSIAFRSHRHGQADVFLVQASGGPATRLTFESNADTPVAFLPSGEGVVFRSARGPNPDSLRFPSGRQTELYVAKIPPGPAQRLLDVPAGAACIDPATGRIFYEYAPSIEDEWRKHHRSSAARDIHAYDPEDRTHTNWTPFAGEDREPVLDPNGEGLYWLSAEAGTLNVFFRKSPAAAPEQITAFKTHPVRSLSISEDGTLCFNWHGEVFIKEPEQEAVRVRIQLPSDFAFTIGEIARASGEAEQFAVSPDGKEVAFVLRGEVFVAATEGGTTRRITQTAAEERDPQFSPDGRALVYASVRDGDWDLYRASLVRKDDRHFFRAKEIKEEVLLKNPSDTYQPLYSPKGDEIAYWEDRTTLKILNLETRAERVVLPGDRNFSYADGDLQCAFAPDGSMLAVEFLNRGHYVTEIGLVNADGKSPPINLSRSGFSDSAVRFSADGSALTWFTTKEGLQDLANTGSREVDVHAIFLTRKAYERYRLPKAELDWLEEDEKEAEKKDDSKKDEKKEDEKPALKPLAIDYEGLPERRARLTRQSARMSDALLLDGGKKLVTVARFEGGYDVWLTDLKEGETKVLVKLKGGPGRLLRGEKDDSFWLATGGGISKVQLNSGERKAVSFRAEMAVDPVREREAVFADLKRTVRAKFYEPTLHGTAWEELCAAYEPKIPQLAHDEEFAELLSELLGELNASHTGARFRGPVPDADETASLGLLYSESYAGAGLEIAAVLAGGPFDRLSEPVKVGSIIESLDGNALGIAPGVAVARILNRRAGERLLVQLFDPESKARREVFIRPISAGAHFELLYRRWVDRQRALTERLSGGRVGYVHVRNMSDSSYRTVFDEVLGRHVEKEALIVDTRFNGGGDLVDDLSRFLRGKPYMDFKTPDGRVIGGEPMRQWTKPSLCLMSEGNYSDAHCFPFAYKELGIGKLVGMPVAGTCTFVWWKDTQIPGLVYGIPNLAVRDLRGQNLENLQLEPDLRVAPNLTQLAAGRDEQLEAGVVELLRTLGPK